jgi:hypothetical protein
MLENKIHTWENFIRKGGAGQNILIL